MGGGNDADTARRPATRGRAIWARPPTFADQARSRFKKLNDKFGLIQATAPLLRAQIALGQAGAAQRSTEELLTLADMSVQGPFPLMAVAGAAMHRGDGATAVAIADRAIAVTDDDERRGLRTAHRSTDRSRCNSVASMKPAWRSPN